MRDLQRLKYLVPEPFLITLAKSWSKIILSKIILKPPADSFICNLLFTSHRGKSMKVSMSSPFCKRIV